MMIKIMVIVFVSTWLTGCVTQPHPHKLTSREAVRAALTPLPHQWRDMQQGYSFSDTQRDNAIRSLRD